MSELIDLLPCQVSIGILVVMELALIYYIIKAQDKKLKILYSIAFVLGILAIIVVYYDKKYGDITWFLAILSIIAYLVLFIAIYIVAIDKWRKDELNFHQRRTLLFASIFFVLVLSVCLIGIILLQLLDKQA